MAKQYMNGIDVETGETYSREFTEDEYADFKAIQTACEVNAQKKADKLAAKASAQAKLAALGLTEGEVVAIVGNQPKRMASL